MARLHSAIAQLDGAGNYSDGRAQRMPAARGGVRPAHNPPEKEKY